MHTHILLVVAMAAAAVTQPVQAFYDSSVEQREVTKDLKSDYGVVSDGTQDISGQLQAAVDAISASGGGVLQIPAGTYLFSNVALKSNVHVEIDSKAVLRPFIQKPQKSCELFGFGSDDNAIENVSVRGMGGRFTVEFPKHEPGLRVCALHHVRNFYIGNFHCKDSLTKFSCITMGPAGLKHGGTGMPEQGTVENVSVANAHYGYGVVQTQAARSVLFQGLSGVGGVTLRCETGYNRMNDAQYGGVADITAENISCTDGNAAVMISPHAMQNGVVKVDGVKSVGCGFAVRIGGGFISKKYSRKDLKLGVFAEGSYVKNITATFGMNAQLKPKHFKYMPEELMKHIQDPKASEDGESVRGPSIAAVVNDANYKVVVENVKANGFEYNPPIVSKADARKGKQQNPRNFFKKQSGNRRPNIIYVMLDDAGYGDFSAMGSQHVVTPTFDLMCAEGMRFTDHYSGSAVCAPTRCVLMTGLHTGHCRRRGNRAVAPKGLPNEKRLIPLLDEDVTVAEALRGARYATGGIGKWGLGNPATSGTPSRQGFDHFLGYLDQVHAHDHYTDWLWNDGERMSTNNRYSHNIFEEGTLDFIRNHKEEPFFLYLPYCLPHGNYVIPRDDPAYQLYKDKSWSQEVRNYAAMITRADRTVGEILKLLKELKIDNETIVFYTSDNGANKNLSKVLDSNAPFQGTKRSLYEGGIRAAMAARWPDHIPAGVTSDFVWDMRDVFPTLCDLAGAPVPQGLDGISVTPTLLGRKQAPRDHLYWTYPGNSQQAVRMGKWKGLRLGTKGSLKLFDLTQDLGETTDLSSENPAVVVRIEQIMDASHRSSPHWPLAEHPQPAKNKPKRKKVAS